MPIPIIVIEFLMSDPVILFCSAVGLVVTGVSIMRDTRSQLARVASEMSEEPAPVELRRAA